MQLRNGNGKPSTTLGAHVRKLRTEKELSLREVAERIGKTIGYLSDFELGRRTAKPATLGKIASALGVTAGELHEVARLDRIATLRSELDDLTSTRKAAKR